MNVSTSSPCRLGVLAAVAAVAILGMVGGCTPMTTTPGPHSVPASTDFHQCKADLLDCQVTLKPDDLICPAGGCNPAFIRDCKACLKIKLDYWAQPVEGPISSNRAFESGQVTFGEGEKSKTIALHPKAFAKDLTNSKFLLATAVDGKTYNTMTMTVSNVSTGAG